MPEIESRLKQIQDKLQNLLKDHSTALKENHRLEKEIEKLKQQSKDQLQTIESLRQQADILKLNSAELNEADKKEIEKRINSYIKEIDRCIALLGE